MPNPYSSPPDNGLQALAKLLGASKGLQVPTSEDYQFSGTQPTQGELGSPFEQEQSRRSANVDAEQHAQAKVVQDWMNQADPRQQALDQQKQKYKLEQETAAPTVTAQGQLAVTKEQEAGKMALQKQQQENTAGILGLGATGQPQAGATAPSAFKPAINAQGGVSFTEDKGPQQVEAQKHAATIGLSQIPALRQLIDHAVSKGLVGPVSGRLNDWMTESGASGAFMNADNAREFSNLKQALSTAKSNFAYIHGAARGGASPAVLQRFDQILNTHQSPEAMRGALDGIERWLSAYAGAKDSTELEMANNQIGISGGEYQRPQ